MMGRALVEAAAARRGNTIQHLNLSITGVNLQGMKNGWHGPQGSLGNLVEGIRHCRRLTSIDVSGNRMTMETTGLMLDALGRLPLLEHVDISENDLRPRRKGHSIPGTRPTQIGGLLQRNRNLKTLAMQTCGLGLVGASNMGRAVT